MMNDVDQNMANLFLSNERTLLSWVRTGIGIMVFGFVVVKFSISVNPEAPELLNGDVSSVSMSTVVGVGLVAIGALATILSYIQYRQTIKQLQRGYYKHSVLLATVISAAILLISVLLVFYLLDVKFEPTSVDTVTPAAIDI